MRFAKRGMSGLNFTDSQDNEPTPLGVGILFEAGISEKLLDLAVHVGVTPRVFLSDMIDNLYEQLFGDE